MLSSLDHDALYTILIVDPNVSEAEKTQAELEAVGHRVVLAHHVDRAIQYLTTEKFDVLFCEIFYPGSNGFEQCKKIWTEIQRLNLNIPMMALTDTTHSEHVRLSFKAGLINFVMKPLTSVKLEAAMSMLRFKQHKEGKDVPTKERIEKEA